MLHDQGEWVTCWQYSILIFLYKSLVQWKCYILIQIQSKLDIWLQRYEQFFEVQNNTKHKNLSPLLACNSKSIFPTSDSFPLIMSHIRFHIFSLSYNLTSDDLWPWYDIRPLTSSTSESSLVAPMTQLWLKSIKACGSYSQMLTCFHNNNNNRQQ